MKLPVTKMAFYMRYDISVIILHLPVALYVSSDENVAQGVCVCDGVCVSVTDSFYIGSALQHSLESALGSGGGGGRWDGRSRVLGDRPST